MPTTTLRSPRNSERAVLADSESALRVAPPGGGQKPPASAARHDRRALSPYADKRSVRLPLSESRRLQDPPPALGGRRRIGADPADGDHAKPALGH